MQPTKKLWHQTDLAPQQPGKVTVFTYYVTVQEMIKMDITVHLGYKLYISWSENGCCLERPPCIMSNDYQSTF